MFKNLIMLMSRKGIGIEELAQGLGMHRNTLKNKLDGESEFTLDQIEGIQKYFSEYQFAYVFARDPKPKETV